LKQSKQKKDTLDWFVPYEDMKKNEILEPIFANVKKSGGNILDIGCGNSTLGIDLWNDGFQKVCCIDFSDVVIKHMNERCGMKEGLNFLKMDVMDLKMEDNSMELVIDKGTLDAVLFNENFEDRAFQMNKEISRILKLGGHFIMISFARPKHRLKFLCHKEFSWSVELAHQFNKQRNLFYLYILTKRLPIENDSFYDHFNEYFTDSSDSDND